MAFKLSNSKGAGPDSPETLLRDLKTKRIAGPLADQADLWRAYQRSALDAKDVALHLPTGGGKTLVGLVLAEWRRRKFGERVVYLCPTRQLVHQVANQANNSYGIQVAALVGSKRDYDRGLSSRYQSGDLVAVTTYSSLFNVSPFFNDPNIVILDDAHAADQYIADMWTVSVQRRSHSSEYAAIAALLEPKIALHHYQRLVDEREGIRDRGWVEKIPSPVLAGLIPEMVPVFDSLFDRGDLSFSWSNIRDHLPACHMYMAAGKFLIRPIIPPTSTHRPFAGARQRIYMSATLGEAGELERIAGRPRIERLAPQTGWEKQTIGRRYFMFPDRSLDNDEQEHLCMRLISVAGRALVLAPDDQRAAGFKELVRSKIGYQVYSAQDIEDSKAGFTASGKAVAVVANRYDGIDFPEEECRLLIVEGLPKATNLHEKFLIDRLGSGELLRVRILTRIVQAFGRCTRSDKDYSAIVLRGEELSKYLVSKENRHPLHPELQAEIVFGMEQSLDASIESHVENFKLLLEQGDDWRAANDAILEERDRTEKSKNPGSDELSASVSDELTYLNAMWSENYGAAFEAAKSVLAKINHSSLRGYRAFWHYLAGSAAWFSHELNGESTESAAREQYSAAQRAEKTLSWLGQLTKIGLEVDTEEGASQDFELLENVERLELLFDRLGTLTEHKFADFERDLRSLTSSNDAREFERGHVLLGELLGYEAGNRNDRGSPDPWWRSSDRFCIVFEDFSGNESSVVSVKKARQACTHPNWVRSEQIVGEDAEIVSMLVAPCTKIEAAAVPHMDDVVYWPLSDFRHIVERAVTLVKSLRRDYPGSGDLAWRARAIQRLRDSGLGPRQFVQALRSEQPELERVG